MHQSQPASLQGLPITLLYQRYAASLLTYVRKHASSVEEAEDILVEVFVAALESDSLFTLTEHQQESWLWRVTHHKLVDSYRRQSRQRHVPLDLFDERDTEDEAVTPEAITGAAEIRVKAATAQQ